MSLSKCFFFLVAVLIFTAFPAHDALGQSVTARGMGTVTWEGRRLAPEQRQDAVHRAKLSAIETHLAETSPARVRLFSERRDEFSAALDRYVLAATVLNETEDPRMRTYTVVVRVDLNAALLQSDLDGASATAQTAVQDRSMMTLLFMARSQASVQRFDERVYQRQDASQSADLSSNYEESTREAERVSSNSIETSGAAGARVGLSAETSSSTTTGGSTTQRADNVAWQVANTNEVNARMGGIFGAAGYEVVEAEYLEADSGGQLSLERIRSDFSQGSDLSPDVLRATVAGVRNAGVPLIALGTLDVGMRDTDPVSGNTRVHVTVTGRILDVTGRFPRTISSVGPVQFAGLGPNETVARNNALSLAAERAAQIMVDEMNLRGVR